MATPVVIYVPEGVECEVKEGSPPVDQSAEVAALTQQVADLTTANAALQSKIDAAKAAAEADKAADAASVAGQGVLDALA